MFKRLQYWFLAFFISLPVLFAAENFAAENFLVRSFNNILGSEGLGALLINESFLYGFYFLLILFTMQSIFRAIFESIKIDKKPAGMVAFMFSAIGTSGIFYLFKDNKEGIVALFGGFFGFIIVLVIGFIIAKTILRLNKGEKVLSAKWFAVIFGAALVYNILIFTVAKQFAKASDITWMEWMLTTSGSFMSFLAVGFIISLVVLFFKRKGSGYRSKKGKIKTPDEFAQENPYNKEILSSMKELTQNNKNIQTDLNSILKRRGGIKQ